MESFYEKAERRISYYKGFQKVLLEESNKRQGILKDFYFQQYHDVVFVTEALEALVAVRKELEKEEPDTEKLRSLVKWDEDLSK